MQAAMLQRYSPIVTIRASRDTRDVAFCFAGAGASVTCFLSLADSLAMPLNVLGGQARGMDGLVPPDSSVEAAAAAYLEAILEIAPQGPYRLLGHSFGGWIAFELAGRLMSTGRDVLPVIMLDTEPPASARLSQARYDRAAALRKYVRALEKTCGRSLHLDVDRLRSAGSDEQMRALLEAMKAQRVLPKSAPGSLLHHPFRVFETQLNIAYAPRSSLLASVYLLHTDDVDMDDDDWLTPDEACERWRGWAPMLQPMRVPGNHMTMLEMPHVTRTAELLQRVWNLNRKDRSATVPG
jgi:arthrofactin-type cyclic lipopeptide synthetase C